MFGHEGTIIAAIATGALLIASMTLPKKLDRAFGGKTAKKGKNGKASAGNDATASSAKQFEAEQKTNNARAYLQTALDQASQADSASARAGSGRRDTRLAAAEQAHYHAVAAEQAAGNATDAAAGGPLEANDAAAQARNAAARARAAADRARYNASVGN